MRDSFFLFQAGLFSLVLTVVPDVSFAQSDAGSDVPSAAADVTQPDALRSIVRGLYFEARVGGGAAVMSADVPEDPIFPQLTGQSEELGTGAQIGLHLGYDVSDAVAIELVSGAAFISGRRSDRVRDVGLFFGGPGLRFGFEADRRLRVTTGGAAVFVRSDNAVDPVESGFGVLLGGGLEYFVHVRHFSVGVDLSVLAPFSPSRVFVGITPRLKYTF